MNDPMNTKVPKGIMVLLIVSVLFNILTFFRTSSLQSEVSNLQNNINLLSSSVNSTVSNNVSQVQNMLEKQGSLVSEFRYDFGAYKDKRIDLLLQVKPKSYTEGEKIYFSYKAGSSSPVLLEAQSADYISFNAQINISVFDDLDIDLVIENGTDKKIEKLESVYRPLEKFAAQISARMIQATISRSKNQDASIVSGSYELLDMGGLSGQHTLLEPVLSVRVNDKEITAMPLKKESGDRYTLQLNNYEIPSKTGDIVDIYCTAKDDRGFSYSCLVSSWKIAQNGGMDMSDKDMKVGIVDIQ